MPIHESQLTIVSEGTRLEGKVHFEQMARVHGTLVGEVSAGIGSTLVLAESGLVEGVIRADVLIVDGFVRGDIFAKTRVQIAASGRVIGNIHSPQAVLEIGCYFEGNLKTERA